MSPYYLGAGHQARCPGYFIRGARMAETTKKYNYRFTGVPDALFNSIDKFSPIEWKIVTFLVRKIRGYSKPCHDSSVRYLAVKLGHGTQAIQQAIHNLLKHGDIIRTGRGHRGVFQLDIHPKYYNVNDDCSENHYVDSGENHYNIKTKQAGRSANASRPPKDDLKLFQFLEKRK